MAKVTKKNPNGSNSLVTVDKLGYFKTLEDAVIDEKVAAVNKKISTAATEQNPALDRESVIQLIATSAGDFLGSFPNWESVPSDPSGYVGGATPKKGDQIIVQDCSDYTEIGKAETWMFKYTGTWADDGKDGWSSQYKISADPFTPEQLAAINSGITAEKVGTIAANEQAINVVTGRVDAAEGDIDQLETDVANLELSKQKKLEAGTNVTLTDKGETVKIDVEAGIQEVSFADITGDAKDNASLATELNKKQDTLAVDDVYIDMTDNTLSLKNLAENSDIDKMFE